MPENNINGYVQHNNQELSDRETFNKNWYRYRNSQLYNMVNKFPILSYIWLRSNTKDIKIPFSLMPTRRMSKEDVAQGIRNYINEQLDSVKEYNYEEAVKNPAIKQHLISTYVSEFEKDGRLPSPKNGINEEILKHLELIKKGVYYVDPHAIVYFKNNGESSTKIHEREHSSRIPTTIQVKTAHPEDADEYLDNPLEVKARLMQVRFDNKLDPEHTYTEQEVENMRKSPSFIDREILGPYDNNTVLKLLNEVAQSNFQNPYKDPNRIRA